METELMNSLSKAELKAVELGLRFLLDDITEELKHYEEARMDEAVQTSREVLEVLYSVLKKVREKGME
jgi:uncharacterized UPF0146 family protein